MVAPLAFQFSNRFRRYSRITGPVVGLVTRSSGMAILMSRVALRSDNTEVWQYCPSHWPPISAQKDCVEADATGVDGKKNAAAIPAADTSLPPMPSDLGAIRPRWQAPGRRQFHGDLHPCPVHPRILEFG